MRARSAALALVVALLAAGCVLPGGSPAPRPYFEEVLSASPFTRLVLEVDHAPGRAPSQEALAHLQMTFRNLTSKQEVTLRVEQTLSAEAKTWTPDALVALERETRSTPHQAPVAVLRVLYPAGQYEREGVAGVTIGGPVLGPAVVFLDTLRNYTLPLGGLPLTHAPLPEASVRHVERATLVHEAGHAIGLVDNGLPMVCPHEDAQHEGHSDNPDSIMWWAVDSMEGVRKMLTGEGKIPDRFDANDLRDVQAAGGRGLPRPASC